MYSYCTVYRESFYVSLQTNVHAKKSPQAVQHCSIVVLELSAQFSNTKNT